MTRIAVDALGGDRAPDEVVAGALEAAADENEELLERAFDEEKENDDATKASS